MAQTLEFVNKFKNEMQLRDAVKDEFLDTYAKMMCLEAVVEEFDHLQVAQGSFAQPESHSVIDLNQDIGQTELVDQDQSINAISAGSNKRKASTSKSTS